MGSAGELQSVDRRMRKVVWVGIPERDSDVVISCPLRLRYQVLFEGGSRGVKALKEELHA